MLMTTRFALSPFNMLNREIGRLLNEVADGSTLMRSFPAINVWEDGDRLIAEAEAPGARMDDLEVLVVGDELTIKGKFGGDVPADHQVLRQERFAGEFSRTLQLPVAIDADKVEATLKDGVLTLSLPKAANARVRKIEVKTV